MAMRVQGGQMVPASTGRKLRPGVNPVLELQRMEEALRLSIQLQDKITQLRMMGGRDPNLDLAIQRARECFQALNNAME